MGLDTTHDAWHGSYNAFSRWRDGLARAAGYWVLDVVEERQFAGARASARPMIILDWGHLDTDDQLQGTWGTEPDDALVYLIAHSDCDGALSPERCARLADRLEELLPLLPTEPDSGHIGDWGQKTQMFIDGARRAAAANEHLEFW